MWTSMRPVVTCSSRTSPAVSAQATFAAEIQEETMTLPLVDGCWRKERGQDDGRRAERESHVTPRTNREGN